MKRIKLSVAASVVCIPTKVCKVTVNILNKHKDQPGFLQALKQNI